MDDLAIISSDTNYRKVYLSDLKQVLNIYKHNEIHQVPDQLTAQFGLPLVIAELNNELIGFASAKMNDLKEVEFISYYRDGVSQTEIQPTLEKLARNMFKSTFNNLPKPEKKLEYAAQRLTEWLNKCL